MPGELHARKRASTTAGSVVLATLLSAERQEWCRPHLLDRTSRRTLQEMHEIRVTFDQLALIHKSLQAVRTLGVLPPQDELLADTMQIVDQALLDAVRTALRAE